MATAILRALFRLQRNHQWIWHSTRRVAFRLAPQPKERVPAPYPDAAMLIVAMWMLTHFTPENIGTIVAPCSHKQPCPPMDEASMRPWLSGRPAGSMPGTVDHHDIEFNDGKDSVVPPLSGQEFERLPYAAKRLPGYPVSQ